MSLVSMLSQFGNAYVSSSGNTSGPNSATCESDLRDGLFYNWMMIPSCIEILLMALFVRRKRRFLTCCWGRPGIVHPIDLFEMQNRTSYMAAFGSIAFLCSEVILESKYVIEYSGPLGLRIFVILLSVIVYGLAFFPIFAALSMRTILSYGLGCLHVWTFAAVAYYETFYCANDLGGGLTMMLVARDLPKLVCLTYLSVMMPLRCIKTITTSFAKNAIVSTSIVTPDDKTREVRESILGRHIRKNFIPPRLTRIVVREGMKGKVLNIVLPVWKLWKYRWNPEFKYSGRFLSTLTVSFILVYKLTCEILITLVNLVDLLLDYGEGVLNYIGWTESPSDNDSTIALRQWVIFGYYLLYAVRVCIIVSTTFELLLCVLLLLHMVSSYRKYLLALHKGITIHIPARDDKSNPSHMVGSLRYGGYQIGYTGWAFVIQWLLFMIISVVLATVVTLYRYGMAGFITDKIIQLWPVPVTTIILSLAQTLISKFVFLQESGEVLAIDNRRGFFVFSYFMFFYNIFLGLVSCLLRIIKAIVIGALFLGRLDHSTLPRRFQLLDPGFDAYVGFLHMENAHRHPVMLAFLAILRAYVPENTHDDYVAHYDQELDNLTSHSVPPAKVRELDPVVNNRRICQRWGLAYTLYFNPHLRHLRKHAISARRAKLEALEEARKERKEKQKEETHLNGPIFSLSGKSAEVNISSDKSNMTLSHSNV